MKKHIFIEAKNKKTPEYVFVTTLLAHWGVLDFDVICVGGKDNLGNVANKLIEYQLEGDKNIILFDADSPANGGGYNVRYTELQNKLQQLGVSANIFLWPNNHKDGEVETLLESIAQRGLHQLFFDCFEDYERCVGTLYNAPDSKGKLYTYMTAQKGLNKKQRDNLSYDWLFGDTRFWDIDSPYLNPLRQFLSAL